METQDTLRGLVVPTSARLCYFLIFDRRIAAANVRQQATGVVVPLITDPGTARAMDLLNVVYEVLLQLLSRYFAHTDETPDQLRVLADVSVGLMFGAIKPLGSVVTTLPIGWGSPGINAGPGFELFYQVDYLLPHREAAWVLMEERLRDAAAFAVRVEEHRRVDAAAESAHLPIPQVGVGARKVRRRWHVNSLGASSSVERVDETAWFAVPRYPWITGAAEGVAHGGYQLRYGVRRNRVNSLVAW